MGVLDATIVIPTCDRRAPLELTLQSLARQSARDGFEVVVVDDGSEFDVATLIGSLGLPYPIRCFHQVRRGFRAARARNTGILFAQSPLVVFLDDDMVVPQDFVEGHLEFHNANPESVGLGLRSRVSHRAWCGCSRPEEFAHFAKPDPRIAVADSCQWEELPWAYFTTCNASVSLDALLSAGLFDEAFEGWGFEDTELGFRLHSIGQRFGFVQRAPPLHLDEAAPTMERADGYQQLSEEKETSYWRNAEYFSGKYPDDASVRTLLAHEARARLLTARGVRTRGVEGNDSTVRAVPRQWAPHQSLLEPYRDGDECRQGELPVAADETNGGRTLLDDLRETFGLDFAKAPPRHAHHVVDFVRAVALTPVVATVSFGFLAALVASGRYRRMFRKERT